MLISPSLHSRYIIDMTFTMKAPLHIGAESDGALKTIVLMNVYGKRLPIIPAESLKGALRSLATRIAKSMKFTNTMWGHLKVDDIVKSHVKDQHVDYVDKLCGELKENDIEKLLISTNLFKKRQIQVMLRELNQREVLELLSSLACPICRIFGARHLAGKLLIQDAIIEGDTSSLRIEHQTHVAISRKCRTAEEGRLFSMQLLSPSEDIRFKARIIADNIKKGEDDAKLLAKLLMYIDKSGLTLGGGKSKGYGLLDVSFDIYRMRFVHPSNEHDIDAIKKNVEALLMKNIEKISPTDLL